MSVDLGEVFGGGSGALIMDRSIARKRRKEEEKARLLEEGAVVSKQHPGGTAEFYDDSWLQVLDQMKSSKGKAGVGGMLEQLLANFKGSPEDLEKFLEQAKPFMAASLEGTKAFQEVQDYGKASNVMGAYGGAAGMIGEQAAQGQMAGQNMMARSGLGRSSAMAGMTQQAAGAVGSQQANLYSNLYQTGLARRADLAQRGLDAHRNVASLALGMNPQIRQVPSGGGVGMGQTIGTGAGALIGGYFGGPTGATVGAGVGGTAGNALD